MLINGINNMVYIGTMSGYLLVYDVRCNLISSIFQLNSKSTITDLQRYPHSGENECISMSLAGDNHCITTFNMGTFNEVIMPSLEFNSQKHHGSIHQPQYLKNKQKYEQFINYNHKYNMKTSNLLDLHRDSHDINQIIQYLSDPIQINQNSFNDSIYA